MRAIVVIFALLSSLTGASAQLILPDSQKIRKITDTSVACSTQEDLRKAVQLSPDNAAFKQFMTSKILARACIFYETGDAVYVTDSAPTKGQFKIRAKGDYREFWVYRNAVE